MIEIIRAGGWLMLPIILCSIIAVAITIERVWTLQRRRVLPKDLATRVWEWARDRQLDQKHLDILAANSPMGQVLAAGLASRGQARDVLKEKVQDTGRHVVHELERYLNTLGTIAAVTPLLGLLGTVIGMVKVFTAITTAGVGNPGVLAGGISEALITTAAGLSVAIPSLIAYRYLRGRVDALVVEIEKEAMKLIDALHRSGQREGAA
ncbi:MotA/TolQ/ExbB proton channel family protein [Thioalkalivibrio sp. XN279]|uniref:MotA/TolQ/ExbB proton channel family protein n=1 Tax=Thioalkalivibrio sp. XN279 TaxID=2714953 RepID=UPI001408D80C|nr:MotA/TolQ/ExbB proton channel family protein [Thioalkalivibrio sp. XN279]NHA14285.1 MotA/TolQ/ExbB proton channel family protein [Thioalkalivibrio sp. XN279]